MRLIGEGKVTSLRIDHPDGLYDPSAYLRMLQKECFIKMKSGLSDDKTPAADREKEASAEFDELTASDPLYKPFYIVGEKILLKGERMPEEWPIFSTTGYVFLNSLNGIFVDSENAKAFDRVYRRFSGMTFNLQDVIYEKKKLITQVAMSSEISALGHYLNLISEKNRHTRDFTLNSLKNAIVEVIAFFPVYRTYVNSLEQVKDRDRQQVESAVSKAKKKNPATSESVYDFLRDVLLLRFPEQMSGPDKQEWLEFTMRFQQITGPIMAKGVEDTAFYIYNRLTSLNEVGGMPDRFGTTLETFHGQNIERIKSWPHALIASSTHDTKRGEDVRARINVLSEIPDEWRRCISRWTRMNRRRRGIVDGRGVPERNDEYLFYQTLLGSWPAEPLDKEGHASYTKRIREYMLKAVREAKVNSSWISPNEKYEAALLAFVDAVMQQKRRNEFLRDFLYFQKKISFFGAFNSLSQVLLKITAPGVPDFYQGTELWDFRLVDPDNRSPVDYGKRIAMLEELKKREAEMGAAGLAKKLALDLNDDRVKLYLTMKALNFRKKNRPLFDSGEYIPLQTNGERRENVCASARKSGGQMVITVAPRFVTRLMPFPDDFFSAESIWKGSELILPIDESEKEYEVFLHNVLTDEIVETEKLDGTYVLPLSRVFKNFPVALLTCT
jgi:(1->4)-alpha-D-glucan 1-alpha-D-glucosylmutase